MLSHFRALITHGADTRKGHTELYLSALESRGN